MSLHQMSTPRRQTHPMRLSFVASPFTTKAEYQAWIEAEDADYQTHLLKKARSRAFSSQQTLTAAAIANLPAGKPLRVEKRIYWGNEYTVRDLQPWRDVHNISHVVNTAHHAAATSPGAGGSAIT